MLIMNKKHLLLTIVLVLLITACNKQNQADDQTPKLEILSLPQVITSGETVEITWQITPIVGTEHTNIHTSFTSDFAERIDTEKQGGNKKVFTDSLVLESDTERTVYVQAHAYINEKDYESAVKEITIKPETDEASDSSNKSASEVTIKDFAFGPASLTVSKGTTVTWLHDDGAPHTVTTTKAPESFGSGNLTKGDSFSQTFDTTGTYEYFCSIHPKMKGTVVVQ